MLIGYYGDYAIWLNGDYDKPGSEFISRSVGHQDRKSVGQEVGRSDRK